MTEGSGKIRIVQAFALLTRIVHSVDKCRFQPGKTKVILSLGVGLRELQSVNIARFRENLK